MQKAQLVAFTGLAVLSVTVTAVIPSAGICHPCHLNRIPITLAVFEANKPFKVMYTSSEVDSEIRDGFRIVDSMYYVADNITTHDNSTGQYSCTMTIVDNVVIEETTDVKGIKRRFKLYLLGITVDFCYLFYRCADDGDGEVDVRNIWVPVNGNVSESGLKYLIDVDSQCHFRGELRKLPEKH